MVPLLLPSVANIIRLVIHPSYHDVNLNMATLGGDVVLPFPTITNSVLNNCLQQRNVPYPKITLWLNFLQAELYRPVLAIAIV